jgi:hypothetical protein
LTRIKFDFRERSSLPLLVENISQWFSIWKSGGFVDGWVSENDHEKEMTLDRLQKQLNRLSHIVQRESAMRDGHPADNDLGHSGNEQLVPQVSTPEGLGMDYEPADHLRIREIGPRHDNDFENIRSIEIPPTQDEMLSAVAPFLPENIPGGAHHLPDGSMERLLDIQFRLLREELL